jgi:hypothetical protein
MNIYQRINEVRKLVDYIQKDKKVEGYMALTHDNVTSETRKHFVDQGIVIVPHLLRSVCKDTGTTTSKGTPFVRMEATYSFDFVNMDDPADRFTTEIEAHALDHGDKAPGKVLSYAKKYAVLKVLEIESGEAEEGREEQHKPKEEKRKESHSPSDGAVEGLPPTEQIKARKVANTIVDLWDTEKQVAAYEHYYLGGHEPEMMLAVWEILRPHSSIRSELKKMHKAAQQ